MQTQDFQTLPGRPDAQSVAQRAASALSGAALAAPVQDVPFPRVMDASRAFFRAGAVVLTLAAPLAVATTPGQTAAQAAGRDAAPIKNRNVGVSRARAKRRPRGEADQALVGGWPLYRTGRGQEAFNHAMATLKATDGAAPAPEAFEGCARLVCNLSLPSIAADGWLRPGRIWVSPTQYVLIVHSPRGRGRRSFRRRASRRMRFFVFHEFQNSTFNTDPYDTISAHSGSVFVPFYMSKQGTDAKGRRFVSVVQVAPYDVVSIHASNKGSAGPGIEVAKNTSGALEPLQGVAGLLVATIVKAAAPQLRVVNHRGAEGRPMLRAYQRRLAALRARPRARTVALPFVPASARRVATVTSRLGDLIVRRGVSPSISIAQRGTAPPRAAIPEPGPEAIAAPAMSPLAAYLSTNLKAMRRLPGFSAIIPDNVAAIGEASPGTGVVYLLDAGDQILGRIEAHQEYGAVVQGMYVYVPSGRAATFASPFELDVSKPLLPVRSAALTPAAAAR